MIADKHNRLIEPFTNIVQRVTKSARITLTSIQLEVQPHQGASGSDVQLYTVGYTNAGEAASIQIVSKDAIKLERQVVQLLTDQQQAIPPAYIPDGQVRGRAPIYMQVARSRSMSDISGDINNPLTERVAQALARIHTTNRMTCPAWLPEAADDYMEELYLSETQSEWETCLQNNAFHAEFGKYDKPLRAALENFLILMRQLTDEGETLTLLNVDLHPDHIRLLSDGQVVFIDWEQAAYGSFYLDIVNYFSIETALIYRDALAEEGYEIPATDFIERYREVGRYMGLRYFEVGLLDWQAGGEQWQDGRWFFHYCLTLALKGR